MWSSCRTGTCEVGTDTLAAITQGGGGQGANTAAWLAHAGSAVTLVAAVGDDLAGRERIAELEAAGVRCAVRAHAGARTGTVVVLTSADERTLITDPGAALLLDPADVVAAIKGAPDAVHLHLSGYSLLNQGSRAGGLAALAAARERGLTTSVDAASAAPLRREVRFPDLGTRDRPAPLQLRRSRRPGRSGQPGGSGGGVDRGGPERGRETRRRRCGMERAGRQCGGR